MSTEMTEAARVDVAGVYEFGEAGYRLSPQQREVWERQGAESSLTGQCVARVRAGASAEALAGAARAVVRRHEALRTGLARRAGARVPAQVIRPEGEVSWREEDLRGLDAEAQARRVDEVAAEEESVRFDFGSTTSLRLALLRLSDEAHVLILTAPSLFADGRSLVNIVEEISRRCSAGFVDEADDEPVQYIQFSEWQNELQEGEEAEEGRRFWRKRLGDLPAATHLPLSHKTVNATSYLANAATEEAGEGRGQRFVGVEFDAETAARLGKTASHLGVSADALLRACWQALLSRLSGRSDLLVSTLCDGRLYEQLRGAVGLFARHLPLPSHAESRRTLAELAREAEDAAQSAAEWQDYFEAGAAPAAPALGYAYEAWGDAAVASGWGVERVRSRLARFALCLRVCDGAGGALRAEVEYDPRVYGREEAGRVAGYVARVVKEACASGGVREVRELTLVGVEERELLLRGWGRGGGLSGGGLADVVEMFEAEAERCGGRTAVECEGRALTYEELNSRANQLARRLRKLGVGPDVTVAICVERSVEMVVALLGVLKAGGAYVPLDLAYSKQRLAFMLEEARTPVLLTQARLAASFQAQHAKVVSLDSGWEDISREGAENLPRMAAPANLAYVLFTSGSTGRPKGVAVERRQLANYVRGIVDKLALPPNAGFATVSTFAADLGNTVIFPSLCTGGRLHVITQERATNPDALADYFERHEIDCLKIVPSHLEALQGAGRPERVLPRRRLVLGGEASRREWVEGLRKLAPGCRLMNHYGPTEATVGVLTYEVGGGEAESLSQTLPLGRPLAGSSVYLLDGRHEPVPAGVVGELYVGGRGVARGYLGRPALTAECFLPDPFAERPGARMYKTGDLARWLPGGQVEFLGRADHQVKIRGFRVELGEIECALAEHPSVKEAVVAARDDASGGKLLVAYLTSRQPQALSAGELQTFLREKLPEYMVPAEFVVLKSLPLNPNGKVDRQSLPDPSGAALQVERVYVAPRTAVEEVLAGIWADVLKLERVGVEDNFFALGGHSLVAMQIMSRVRNTFRIDLPLRVVFEATTVEKLARGVVEHEPQPGQSERIAQVVKKMRGMSDEEKRALLRQRAPSGAGRAQATDGPPVV